MEYHSATSTQLPVHILRTGQWLSGHSIYYTLFIAVIYRPHCKSITHNSEITN